MKSLHRTLGICLALMVNLNACYKETDYNSENRNLNQLFTLNSDTDSVLADGKSYVTMTVDSLPIDIEDSGDSIIIKTNFGNLNNSPDPVVIRSELIFRNNKYYRRATAILRGGLIPGTASVTATLKGVSKTKNIVVFNAFPDSIKIQPDRIFIEPSISLGIKFEVKLIRRQGLPSIGNTVTFVVTDTLNKQVGNFLTYDNKSDSNGKCYFNYFYTDTLYKGILKAKASIVQPPIADSLQLFIK